MTTIEALSRKEAHVGVVGLGYVGRPLAAALYRHFSVYGFDTDARLIRALRGEAGATRAPHADAGRLRGMGSPPNLPCSKIAPLSSLRYRRRLPRTASPI